MKAFLLLAGILAGAIAGVCAGFYWIRRQRRIEKMLADFCEQFPGKCPVCSFHRYGVSHGYQPPKPDAHYCPEAR